MDKVCTHSSQNGFDEEYRSTFPNNYCYETALLEVANTIFINIDNQNVTFLTLLDISAAFDIVVYNRILTRIESKYKIINIPTQVMASYFQDRYQTDQINNSTSNPSN